MNYKRFLMENSCNTTESGMWENERQVCETSCSKDGGLAEAAVSKSPSTTSSNNDDDGGSSLQQQQNAKDYLPQFIVRRFGDDIPLVADSCKLNSKFRAKSGTIQFRYTVSWMEDGPVHQEIKQKKNLLSSRQRASSSSKAKKNPKKESKVRECKSVARTPPSRKSCIPKASAARSVSSFTLKSEHSIASSLNQREINVELGNALYEPHVRMCDGPCGQMRALADLHILGRCEHAICCLCVVNAPMVPQNDGTSGCCNKRCFALDLVNQLADQRRRHNLYQNIFKNKKYAEIFKLYNGDIRRSTMPRADFSLSNISHVSKPSSNSSIQAHPSSSLLSLASHNSQASSDASTKAHPSSSFTSIDGSSIGPSSTATTSTNGYCKCRER